MSWLERIFLKTRTVFLTGEINDEKAGQVCKQLMALALEEGDPITLVVSSPGGHVESGDMIHDMLGFLRPKARVRVLGTGWVASAGTLIFVGVPVGDRYCLPNTRFLLHEPRGGIGGMESDIAIQVAQIRRMRGRLNEIMSKATGQPLERIEQDTQRDYWMNAQEAKDYGLVGHIITNIDEFN